MNKIKLKSIVSEIIKEMIDINPVHQKINNKLMQIARRGFESDDDEKYAGDADNGNKILDKANPDNVAAILRGEKPMKEGEEKTYVVYYYTMDKRGEDLDWDVEVQATSEEDAISKIKAKGIRNARAFSAKLK